MKYFLPDSQDLVDPSFDFVNERRSVSRLRHRDDQYAHELFSAPTLDGYLVSKGIVDGIGSSGGRYTVAQRQRLLRVGAREFFRLPPGQKQAIELMGDCGAFTYVNESVPPYSVDELIAFYHNCSFDYGISLDHAILGFDSRWDLEPAQVPVSFRDRQELTLELAKQFLARCTKSHVPFEPIGVAQGWSPGSYARAARELQKMGYRYIALGGMVPLKTAEITASLTAVDGVRRPDTRIHLLGVTRTDQVNDFARLGVASFDSTSPLRQAFKDARDNYYTPTRAYTAIRIPQVEGNPRLQKQISSGRLPQGKALELERASLEMMRRFDDGSGTIVQALSALRRYDDFCGVSKDYAEVYREVLTARPWKSCACDVCTALGHHVILFRGAERNRRRGLHNVWVFYRRLQQRFLHPTRSDKSGQGNSKQRGQARA